MASDLTHNLDELKAALERYVAVSSKTAEEALAHQASQASYELYRETKELGPSAKDIDALPARENWRIKRKKGMAVLNKTTQENTIERTITRTLKSGEVRRYLRKKKLKPQVLMPGEIERRKRHLGFSATGWLMRTWGPLRSDGSRQLRTSKSGRGVLMLYRGKGLIEVILRNPLPGAELLNRKYSIVDKVASLRAQDMEIYIKRKLRERAQELGLPIE